MSNEKINSAFNRYAIKIFFAELISTHVDFIFAINRDMMTVKEQLLS